MEKLEKNIELWFGKDVDVKEVKEEEPVVAISNKRKTDTRMECVFYRFYHVIALEMRKEKQSRKHDTEEDQSKEEYESREKYEEQNIITKSKDKFAEEWHDRILNIVDKQEPLSTLRNWMDEGMRWKDDFEKDKDQSHFWQFHCWIANSTKKSKVLSHDHSLLDSALKLAAQGAHVPLIEFLAQLGADNWDSAFINSCRSGDLDLVKNILNGKFGKLRGFYTNDGNVIPYHTTVQVAMAKACKYQQEEIMRFLLRHSPVAANDNIFGLACQGGSVDIVKLLLPRSVACLESGMHIACRCGHLPLVKFLSERGSKKHEEICPSLTNWSSYIDSTRFDRDEKIPVLRFLGKKQLSFQNLDMVDMTAVDKYSMFTKLGFPLVWFNRSSRISIQKQRIKNKNDARRHLKPFVIPVLIDLLLSFV